MTHESHDLRGGERSTVSPLETEGPATIPVPVADSASTAANTPVTVDVVANNTHVDSEILTLVSASVAGIQGSVTVNVDNTLTYTPALGFSGPAAITYVVEDESGDEATGTLTVEVATDPGPTAVADAGTTAEDTPVTIDVLGNYTHPLGDDLTITAVTVVGGSATGTVTITLGHSITYTPAANFNGTAIVTYTVEDENGDTANGTLTITVTPVTDNPVANADTATTNAGIAIDISVLANDTDPDGSTLTLTSCSIDPAEGTVSVITGNKVRYVPASGFHGSATISYVVTNAGSGTDTGTVTVSVNNVPDVDADLFADAVAPYYSRQVGGSTASFSASGSGHWANSEGLGGPSTTTGVEWRITVSGTRGTVRLQAFTLPMPNGKSQLRWRVKPVGNPLPKLYVALGALDMTSNFFCAFDITDDATLDAARVVAPSAHISNAGITKHPTNGWWYIRFDADVTGLADRERDAERLCAG